MSTSSESALIIKRLTLKVGCVITYPVLYNSLESTCVCVCVFVCEKTKSSTGFRVFYISSE